jgi:hypothetical protein
MRRDEDAKVSRLRQQFVQYAKLFAVEFVGQGNDSSRDRCRCKKKTPALGCWGEVVTWDHE